MIPWAQKYSVLIGIAISLVLLMIAVSVYPGGTMFDEYSTGFDWKYNFASNLFGERALNGAENPSRFWACTAMVVLPLSYAVFFFHMAKKIPEKNAGIILKYGGVANILFTFLTVTHLHDLMLILSTTSLWTCIVVITVFIFKTNLRLFKLCCAMSLLTFYYSVYLWGISDWHLLPLMQKVNFVTSTLLILGFEYFTTKEDFAHIRLRRERTLVLDR